VDRLQRGARPQDVIWVARSRFRIRMTQRFEEKRRLFQERDGWLNGAGGSGLHAAPPLQTGMLLRKNRRQKNGRIIQAARIDERRNAWGAS
jgi:hypothetical protein